MKNSQRGFGFIETMVSFFLLTILGWLVFYFVMAVETEQQSQLQQAREDLLLLSNAIGVYQFDFAKPVPHELNLLVTTGVLNAIPKDPWGNAYIYNMPAVYSPVSFDLLSYGPDGVISDDDILHWELYFKAFRGLKRAGS